MSRSYRYFHLETVREHGARSDRGPGLDDLCAIESDAVLLDLAPPVVSTAPGRPIGPVSPGGSDPAAAREFGCAVLTELTPRRDAWVRIHPGPTGLDDARAVVAAGAAGLFVGRTESPVQLDALDAVLSVVEHDAGRATRSVPVIVCLESAGGVLAATAVARSPRVVALYLDEGQVGAELGVHVSPDQRELLAVRSLAVLASAAAGLTGPIASPAAAGIEREELRESTEALRRCGFRSRVCIDAAQVAVANEAFEPGPDELAAARAIVEQHQESERGDSSGHPLIDEAMARRARRILDARPHPSAR